ncbi:type I-U CRISPR-associated protein Cas7 [Actinophytocola sp. S1-96]|uniref:Type I-U CRISPR-associated protein Cas7 n=1 Tax=Actinophytocola gossypii TaxID=2812003 RepID=A0ABT2JI50_9PSEU|nr:type I-U CRISPR-associated protein Cas7 [Actinophytocola gossypii]
MAPAKFASRVSPQGTYAYETRYDKGVARDVVLIDSKQSQLNRVEEALSAAIVDGHETLVRVPRMVVSYESAEYTDLDLPHRAFDGHFRAGFIDGKPATQNDSYRRIRDANPGNALALLENSPASLVFGAWDSSRAARQGRWRSILVGEIIGFCEAPSGLPELKGGARVDPHGMQVQLTGAALKALAERQREELSKKTFDKVVKAAKGEKLVSASAVGLGGIPPSLETLAGVACESITRSHVLSFAALRQIRFGKGPEGDSACRALLAALALAGLARSDAELVLRANCDLVEAGPTRVVQHERAGQSREFASLSVEDADALLAAALDHAERTAEVVWDGVTLRFEGDPAIGAGAVDDESNGE